MPRFRPLLVALFLLAASVVSACSVISGSDERTITMQVGPVQVDCQGEGQQKCLIVKENGAAEWTYFYGQIEGFTWQPGYVYTLVVAVREIDNPPADGSSRAYRLVKVVEKTPVTFIP
ncbi:MAG TPA: DUF4377 domain-containing protein [Longimicrobium sp.]